ncbi:hypothetical protein ATZ36_11000 [Candidatus Endomicrobiellum trichonymphae]|uniref:Uncharacterized protein n=1 Tax=Endomicrobium trichonymphae TaxID=1408204 RepID=A0A1E5IG90_ENDTX|nr:hypothetical protein ATZ36_11000 [Candidatus Endomicrobium trichonymphae]
MPFVFRFFSNIAAIHSNKVLLNSLKTSLFGFAVLMSNKNFSSYIFLRKISIFVSFIFFLIFLILHVSSFLFGFMFAAEILLTVFSISI